MASLYINLESKNQNEALQLNPIWSSGTTHRSVSSNLSTAKTQNTLIEALYHIPKMLPPPQTSFKKIEPRVFQRIEDNTGARPSLLNFGLSVEKNLRNGSLDFSSNGTKWSKTKSNIVTKADLPKNNVIDLDRIALGLDTRTTLMLRNIPNKVDQQMLKDYIDVTNKNTYDFLCMYN
jgi:hypothetical protein